MLSKQNLNLGWYKVNDTENKHKLAYWDGEYMLVMEKDEFKEARIKSLKLIEDGGRIAPLDKSSTWYNLM